MPVLSRSIAAALLCALTACAALSPTPIWGYEERTPPGVCVKNVQLEYGSIRHRRGFPVESGKPFCAQNGKSTFQAPLPEGRLKASWSAMDGARNAIDIDVAPVLAGVTLNGGYLRFVYGPDSLEIWVFEANTKRVGALPNGALPPSLIYLPKLVLRQKTAIQ